MFFRRPLWLTLTLSLFLTCSLSPAQADEETDKSTENQQVSYYEQIRPIFQRHCQGCHQPAKSSGKYVMTSFDKLLAGGESEAEAVIAGKPDASFLIDMIKVEDGKAEMPKGKKPLADVEIELIKKWITQGPKTTHHRVLSCAMTWITHLSIPVRRLSRRSIFHPMVHCWQSLVFTRCYYTKQTAVAW